ncbi:hypothetical protein [Methylomonas albis]|nr:hypothetical protein [Methylomonas albis]
MTEQPLSRLKNVSGINTRRRNAIRLNRLEKAGTEFKNIRYFSA